MLFPRCGIVCSGGDCGLSVCVSLLFKANHVHVMFSSCYVVCSNGSDGLLVCAILTMVGKARLCDVVLLHRFLKKR